MWIREKLEKDIKEKIFHRGRVISSGKESIIAGEESLRGPEFVLPYGYFCAVPVGTAVISAEGKLMGVAVTLSEELNEGEILLKNPHGAEILLRNDGAVVINGHVFERGEG